MTWLRVLASSAVLACAATAAEPKFEVASVRLCRAGDGPSAAGFRGGRKGGGGRVGGSPGRLNEECRTVASLIADAYLGYADGKAWPVSVTTGLPNPPVSMRLMAQAVKGGPSWLNSDRYTIEAVAQGPQTAEMMRGPMMRALLEERFRLKVHRETREFPVYELTVAKGGPKLQAAQKGGCIAIDLSHLPEPPASGKPAPLLCGAVRSTPNHEALDMSGVTMADFCRQFSATLDRDVIDRTGLTGVFDLHLELSPDDLGFGRHGPPVSAASAAPDPADMFIAVRTAVQKLGLRLEAAKASGEFLVIDSIERPSEN